tara:strand:+ start:4012 stop:4197 length:186 start_codon:yes stop_codon:yes gene_type:complete
MKIKKAKLRQIIKEEIARDRRIKAEEKQLDEEMLRTHNEETLNEQVLEQITNVISERLSKN